MHKYVNPKHEYYIKKYIFNVYLFILPARSWAIRVTRTLALTFPQSLSVCVCVMAAAVCVCLFCLPFNQARFPPRRHEWRRSDSSSRRPGLRSVSPWKSLLCSPFVPLLRGGGGVPSACRRRAPVGNWWVNSSLLTTRQKRKKGRDSSRLLLCSLKKIWGREKEAKNMKWGE